jgi:CBS domain-containing protein
MNDVVKISRLGRACALVAVATLAASPAGAQRAAMAPPPAGPKTLVGIVSEGDLLGRPSKNSPKGWWLRLFSDEAVCLEELATARHLKAEDVMTRHVISISDQAPIDLVASLMHRHRLKRVPVIGDGKLVGIVSRADLLDALVGRREESGLYSLGDLG